ncbi:MAG: hypothetical protein ACREFF_02845 [Candidatus Udaeobacter sp.]
MKELEAGDAVDARWLALRGKNLMFIAAIADALQLDTTDKNLELSDYKRAFTPQAIKKIYEASATLWPDANDLNRVLRAQAATTTGLYVGRYRPEIVLQGVTRHTLYCDKILLVDPFTDPRRVRPEYNPVLHPQKYRTTALMCAELWLSLAPWIFEGLVNFIRTPADFDMRLLFESYQIEEQREKDFPELVELRSRQAHAEVQEDLEMLEYFMLHEPNDELERFWRATNPGGSEADLARFMRSIENRRARHPYYNDPFEYQRGKGSVSEFIVTTTGTNYEIAKRTALITGSHLITDLQDRWREIELDRAAAKIDERKWSPFAKAFHNVSINYLENVPLDSALMLRKEERLEHMRAFLRKVWRASGDDTFDAANVDNLAAELLDRVQEAEDEWRKIDRDLIKWLGTTGIVSSFVGAGAGSWLPVATTVVTGGIAALAAAKHARTSFDRKFPAGFFLKLEKAQPHS